MVLVWRWDKTVCMYMHACKGVPRGKYGAKGPTNTIRLQESSSIYHTSLLLASLALALDFEKSKPYAVVTCIFFFGLRARSQSCNCWLFRWRGVKESHRNSDNNVLCKVTRRAELCLLSPCLRYNYVGIMTLAGMIAGRFTRRRSSHEWRSAKFRSFLHHFTSELIPRSPDRTQSSDLSQIIDDLLIAEMTIMFEFRLRIVRQSGRIYQYARCHTPHFIVGYFTGLFAFFKFCNCIFLKFALLVFSSRPWFWNVLFGDWNVEVVHCRKTNCGLVFVSKKKSYNWIGPFVKKLRRFRGKWLKWLPVRTNNKDSKNSEKKTKNKTYFSNLIRAMLSKNPDTISALRFWTQLQSWIRALLSKNPETWPWKQPPLLSRPVSESAQIPDQPSSLSLRRRNARTRHMVWPRAHSWLDLWVVHRDALSERAEITACQCRATRFLLLLRDARFEKLFPVECPLFL